MTVGHPHPPDKVRAGVEAWREGLVVTGRDPKDHHCQYHLRTYVHEKAATAQEIGQQAISRYEAISRIQRKAPLPPGYVYDWKGMLETGRNLYGNPDQCIDIINNARRHYHFDTPDPQLQLRRPPARGSEEVHAPLRPGSHAGVPVSMASFDFAPLRLS